MSDPLFFDPQECNADVRDYTRLLQRSARGHVLWEPCAVGHVGDCGQIRDGRFWKFFNVYESPPAGIPRLEPPGAPDELRTTVFENRDVLRSSESVSVSFHGGLPFTAPPATLSINAGMSWDKSEFAFLGFGGRQRILEVLSPPRSEALQRYLIQYERHIRAAMGVLSGDIVILGGVTRAPAWMGGVARCTSLGISGSVSLDIGAISIDWGASVARSRSMTSTDPLTSTASWALTRGPAGWIGESSRVEMSTVVVSPVRVKRRHKIVSQLLSLLRTTTSSSTTVAVVPGEAIQNTAHSQLSISGTPMSATYGGTIGNDCDDAAESPTSSEDDDLAEDDLLSIVMQKILDAHPSLEVVAGSWEVIADFLATHPNVDFESDIDPTFKVAGGNVAFLLGLSLRTAVVSHISFPAGMQTNQACWPDTRSDSHMLANTTHTPLLRQPSYAAFQGSIAGYPTASRSSDTTGHLQLQGAPAQILGKRSSSWIDDDSSDLTSEAGLMESFPGPCTHCKKLKMMCNRTPPNADCDRCITNGQPECLVDVSRSRGSPSAHESTCRRQMEPVTTGHTSPPPALDTSRIDPITTTRTMPSTFQVKIEVHEDFPDGHPLTPKIEQRVDGSRKPPVQPRFSAPPVGAAKRLLGDLSGTLDGEADPSRHLACANCRPAKRKCVISPPNTACDSCIRLNIHCRSPGPWRSQRHTGAGEEGAAHAHTSQLAPSTRFEYWGPSATPHPGAIRTTSPRPHTPLEPENASLLARHGDDDPSPGDGDPGLSLRISTLDGGHNVRMPQLCEPEFSIK